MVTLSRARATGDPSTGTGDDRVLNSFGRLRDVVSGPDGTLWFVTDNTDGRGSPAPGDDRLDQVRLNNVQVRP